MSHTDMVSTGVALILSCLLCSLNVWSICLIVFEVERVEIIILLKKKMLLTYFKIVLQNKTFSHVGFLCWNLLV